MRSTLLKIYKFLLPIVITVVATLLGSLAQGADQFGVYGPVIAATAALLLSWINRHKAQPAVVRALSLPATPTPSPSPSSNGRYNQ